MPSRYDQAIDQRTNCFSGRRHQRGLSLFHYVRGGGGGTRMASRLNEGLREANGCQGRRIDFPLRGSYSAAVPVPVTNPLLMHMEATMTELNVWEQRT